MKKVFNFSAGPSVLPEAVLKRAQKDLLNYNDTGLSVMEMSHRSKMYESIHNQAIKDFRDLLNLSDDYEILFIQGGASMQFAMLPMNFGGKAYYVDGGLWGKKAYQDAVKVLGDEAVLLASSKDVNYSDLPVLPEIPNEGSYLHFTSNNTTEGTCMYTFPETKLPLVVDMSSNILSVDYDFNQFDAFYAGAQKNLGPSGVTVLVIKKDFLDKTDSNLPGMLDYKTYANANSMYNTPPTYAIYIMGLVLQWAKNQGGVKSLQKRAQEKANILYDFLDSSKLFKATVQGDNRSINNITFTTGSETTDKACLKYTLEHNLLNLKGHRLVGGLRASIYNAMPKEGVETLVKVLSDFEKKLGGK